MKSTTYFFSLSEHEEKYLALTKNHSIMLTNNDLKRILTETIDVLTEIVVNPDEPAYARTKAASALNNAIKAYRDLFPEEPERGPKMKSLKSF